VPARGLVPGLRQPRKGLRQPVDAAAYRFFQVGCRIHWFLNRSPSGSAPQVAWRVGQESLMVRMMFTGAHRFEPDR
jgi:hypothetical protein